MIEKKHYEKDKGFIALTSVSFLSAFFIILLIGVFFSVTEGIERALDKEMSMKALSYSNSCAETALNELTKDANYGGDETITFEENEICEIKEIENFGLNGRVIKSEGIVFDKTKRIQIEVDVEEWPDLKIVNWREVDDFY